MFDAQTFCHHFNSFHRFGALGCCQGLSRLKDALTSTGLATICEQFLEARKADSEEVQKLSDSDFDDFHDSCMMVLN